MDQKSLINMEPMCSTPPTDRQMSFDEFLADFITDSPILYMSAASTYTDDGASAALLPATTEIPQVLPSATLIPDTTEIQQNLAASTSNDVATIYPSLIFTTEQWERIHKIAEEL